MDLNVSILSENSGYLFRNSDFVIHFETSNIADLTTEDGSEPIGSCAFGDFGIIPVSFGVGAICGDGRSAIAQTGLSFARISAFCFPTACEMASETASGASGGFVVSVACESSFLFIHHDLKISDMCRSCYQSFFTSHTDLKSCSAFKLSESRAVSNRFINQSLLNVVMDSPKEVGSGICFRIVSSSTFCNTPRFNASFASMSISPYICDISVLSLQNGLKSSVQFSLTRSMSVPNFLFMELTAEIFAGISFSNEAPCGDATIVEYISGSSSENPSGAYRFSA